MAPAWLRSPSQQVAVNWSTSQCGMSMRLVLLRDLRSVSFASRLDHGCLLALVDFRSHIVLAFSNTVLVGLLAISRLCAYASLARVGHRSGNLRAESFLLSSVGLCNRLRHGVDLSGPGLRKNFFAQRSLAADIFCASRASTSGAGKNSGMDNFANLNLPVERTRRLQTDVMECLAHQQ